MWNSKFHIMLLLLFFRGVILKDQIKTAQEIQIIIAIIEGLPFLCLMSF